MAEYVAPLKDMKFVLEHVVGLDQVNQLPGWQDLTADVVEAILEEAGVHDVLCKSLGSSNHINVARATIAGLKGLKRPDEVARLRGLDVDAFVPKGMLAAYNESQRGPQTHVPEEVA